jgi:hypothetical protein
MLSTPVPRRNWFLAMIYMEAIGDQPADQDHQHRGAAE